MVRSVGIHADGVSLEEIDIRKDKQSSAYDRGSPEQKPFLFDHPRINQKESEAIESMENEEKEERKVKGFTQMERGKPGDCLNLSHQGITGDDF